MNKSVLYLGVIVMLLTILSCGDDVKDKVIEEEETEVFIDNPDAEETAADTSSTGVYQEEVSDENQSLEDAMTNTSETVEEEGGMSFCDCVKKNKELEKIMMSDETSDEDFDKAMAEMEAMKTGDCKILFPNQSNIDDVNAHKRRVKKCL